MTDAAISPPGLEALLLAVAERARASGVFGEVRTTAARLSCTAKDSAEPAEYRVFFDSGRLFVALVTEHRWLSQSIEADLVHTGDKLDDLIAEELVEQGWTLGKLSFEHFRDERKLYTFRSSLPIDAGHLTAAQTSDLVTRALLAYESAFRPLGDMEADDDE